MQKEDTLPLIILVALLILIYITLPTVEPRKALPGDCCGHAAGMANHSCNAWIDEDGVCRR